MKDDTLQVGTDGGKFHVVVPVTMPENLGDCAEKSCCSPQLEIYLRKAPIVTEADKTAVAYMVSKFTRGHRIDLQEGGARQVVIEKLAGRNSSLMMRDQSFVEMVKREVVAEIAAFDSAAPRARGRKAAPPQEVVLDSNKLYTADDIKAMAAQIRGLTVTIEDNDNDED